MSSEFEEIVQFSDSVDGTDGYQGFMQFVLGQQNGAQADNGFEISNNGNDETATPKSTAVLANGLAPRAATVGYPRANSHGYELCRLSVFEHLTTAEYTCRFRWEPNSIAIWDNRSTQHKPINDYFPAHRRLERITIDGDRPY